MDSYKVGHFLGHSVVFNFLSLTVTVYVFAHCFAVLLNLANKLCQSCHF